MQDQTLRLFHLLHTHPVITQDAVCRELGSSQEAIGTCVENLRKLGILQECGNYPEFPGCFYYHGSNSAEDLY